jgi:hypothetical protein
MSSIEGFEEFAEALGNAYSRCRKTFFTPLIISDW